MCRSNENTEGVLYLHDFCATEKNIIVMLYERIVSLNSKLHARDVFHPNNSDRGDAREQVCFSKPDTGQRTHLVISFTRHITFGF